MAKPTGNKMFADKMKGNTMKAVAIKQRRWPQHNLAGLKIAFEVERGLSIRRNHQQQAAMQWQYFLEIGNHVGIFI